VFSGQLCGAQPRCVDDLGRDQFSVALEEVALVVGGQAVVTSGEHTQAEAAPAGEQGRLPHVAAEAAHPPDALPVYAERSTVDAVLAIPDAHCPGRPRELLEPGTTHERAVVLLLEDALRFGDERPVLERGNRRDDVELHLDRNTRITLWWNRRQLVFDPA